MQRLSKFLPLAILSVVFVVSGCTLVGGDLDTEVYEGFYSWGFEVSSFETCDRDEEWWVTSGSESASRELNEEYRELVGQEGTYDTVYVRLYGTPSEKGKHGHMGGYEREFELRQVREIRAAQPDDCQ